MSRALAKSWLWSVFLSLLPGIISIAREKMKKS